MLNLENIYYFTCLYATVLQSTSDKSPLVSYHVMLSVMMLVLFLTQNGKFGFLSLMMWSQYISQSIDTFSKIS